MNGPRDDDYDSLRDLMGGTGDADSDPENVDEKASGVPAGEGSGDADLPPGLPPEYAEAYRAGYERARREEESGSSSEPSDSAPDPTDEPTASSWSPVDEPASGGERHSAAEATAAIPVIDEPLAASPNAERQDADLAGPYAAGAATQGAPAPGHEPTQQIPVGQVPPPVPPSDPVAPAYVDGEEQEGRRFPLVPALLILAVVLVVVAFGVGRLLADNAAESEKQAGGSGGSGSSGGQNAAPYDGAVQAATIAGATASCQARSSVDAAGNPTTYEPGNAYDRNLTTAWRCAGSGKGQSLTITLPEGTEIAEVGLVPGYAKTDPVSGADRYAQNNRITRVRWRFDDGSSVVQRMGGSAQNRSMRTQRIAPTTTRKVVLEILGSQRGPRNTVAISEIRLASPAG
jgi:hypothetical protein